MDWVQIRVPHTRICQSAVSNQQPFDGPESTLSTWAAGAFTSVQAQNPRVVRVLKNTPVCGGFFQGNIALSQVQLPHTDVYLLTREDWQSWCRHQHGQFGPWTTTVTESTLVHEALHQITGLSDDDLRIFLGLPQPSDPDDTTDINGAVIISGCAAE